MKWLPDDRLPPGEQLSPVAEANRRLVNSLYGGYERQVRFWRGAFFGLLPVTLLLAGGTVYIGSESRIVPYVFAMDHAGEETPLGEALRTAPSDPVLIDSEVCQWVIWARTVSVDQTVNKNDIKYIYQWTDKDSPAVPALNDWFKSHVPWERARYEAVSLENVRALPDPSGPHQWKVEWTEVETSRGGTALGRHTYEMLITFSLTPPKTLGKWPMTANGFHVRQFSWMQKS